MSDMMRRGGVDGVRREWAEFATEMAEVEAVRTGGCEARAGVSGESRGDEMQASVRSTTMHEGKVRTDSQEGFKSEEARTCERGIDCVSAAYKRREDGDLISDSIRFDWTRVRRHRARNNHASTLRGASRCRYTMRIGFAFVCVVTRIASWDRSIRRDRSVDAMSGTRARRLRRPWHLAPVHRAYIAVH
jgi:hypothetical protein